MGFETIVVTPPGPAVQFFEAQGLRCVAFAFPRPRRKNLIASALRFAGGIAFDTWRLARLLRELEADILHCNGVLTLIGPPAGRLAGVATVWHLNDMQTPRAVNRTLLKSCGGMVARIAVASHAVAAHALDSGAPYSVLYPPADLSRCRPSGPRAGREVLLSGLGLDPSVPTLLTVGHLNTAKGHRHLLDAVVRLRANGRRVQLIVVGDRIDTEVSRAIDAQVAREGLGDVRFVGGAEDIAPFLHAADVFVLPSLTEAMPMALLEAMAAGLPVVSTAVGGVAEAIEDGIQGLLSPPGDAAALARQIGRMLDDTVGAKAMGRRARVVAEERFSTEASARAQVAVYREALAAQQAR